MFQSLCVSINDAETTNGPSPNLVRQISPLLSPNSRSRAIRSISDIFDDKKALALAEVAEQEMLAKSAFPEKYQYAGYLSVRCNDAAHWSRMYCVLSNNFLFAADTKYCTKLSFFIALEGCNTKLTTTQSSDMIFQIHKHCFRANSPQLCKEWIANIQKASHLTIYDIYRFRYELGCSMSANAKVIAAKHKVSNQEYAIKIMNKHKCNDKSILLREIQILKKLKSPYIVELCDLFETQKYLYIVMEYCKGGELFDQIANMDYYHGDRYTEQDVHSIMLQLASGVQYMHDMGIVHRDLKPENILCVEPNSIQKIKIADFGISAMVDPDRMRAYRSRRRHYKDKSSMLNVVVPMDDTMMKTRVGTLSYTAPEILKYKPYDERVDYWSLGVIMYILVCGYPPFDAENEYALCDEIMSQQVEFDAQDWSHVGEGTEDLIRRLLDKNPRRRANCQDIIQHSWKIDVKTASFRNAHKKFKQTVFKRKLHTRAQTIEYGYGANDSLSCLLKERMFDLQELGINSLDDSVLKQKRNSHNNEILNMNTIQFDAEHKENQIDAWQVGGDHTPHEQRSKPLECLDLLNMNPIEHIMIHDETLLLDSPATEIMSFSNRSSISENAELFDSLYPSTGTHSKQNSSHSISSFRSRSSLMLFQSPMEGFGNKRRSISKQQQRKKRKSMTNHVHKEREKKRRKAKSSKRYKADQFKDNKRGSLQKVKHKIQISDYEFTDYHLNIANPKKHQQFTSL